MIDLLIKGGTVVDKTVSPARRADVGVVDRPIAFIGGTPAGEEATRIIDADGLVVAPGAVRLLTVGRRAAQLQSSPVGAGGTWGNSSSNAPMVMRCRSTSLTSSNSSCRVFWV